MYHTPRQDRGVDSGRAFEKVCEGRVGGKKPSAGEEGLVARLSKNRDDPIIDATTEAKAESDLCGGHINTIYGGFAGGGSSTSTRKRHLRELIIDQDDPMVITTIIARYNISKVLINQESSINILYRKTFKQINHSKDLIVPCNE